MEFQCICTPPWEEEHEFILEDNILINNSKIEKINIFGNIQEVKDNANIYYDKLKSENVIEKVVDSEYIEVYYFAEGEGKIIIDEKENIIHEAECFLINSNSKYTIIVDTDLIYSRVIEKKI